MSVSKFQKAGLAAIAFAAGLNMVEPAFAADLSTVPHTTSVPTETVANLTKCVSKQEMLTRINNEGQYILVTADRPAATKDGLVQLRNLFTSSKDFSYGYQIAPNAAGNFCKVDSYKDVVLLDATKFDSRTIVPANKENVQGSLANALRAGSKLGQNPVIQYKTTFTDAKGNARVTVAGQIGGEGAYLVADENSGMVTDLKPFNNIAYTQVAKETLGQASVIKTASLTP